ncbi:MAG: hypothetical protein ACM33B_14930 [Pseudomonadota bacterium]
MLWVWVSLGIALAALVGSIAFVVVKTLAAWRGFRSFSGSLGGTLAGVTASADAVAVKAAAVGDDSERLAAALERLGRSRARLAVLSAAISDVREAVGRVTGIVPRK